MDTKPASTLVPHPTTFIELKRLKFGHEHPHADVNIRRPDRESAMQLVSSIRAEGLLQSLLVAPDPDHGGEGPYYTIAGGRRLMALQILREAGELASDALISCVVANDAQFDYARALTRSLACEDTHVPPHPVDRYEAFARLAAEPMQLTPEAIAARFFVDVRVVRQALALGELAPEIRAAWRAGELAPEIAQLFTLADDHKHQVKVLGKLIKTFGNTLHDLRADTVRKEFTGSEAEARRWLAFVGKDAYLAAGGRLTEDLFAGTAQEPALIVHDVGKLKKLAEAKLEVEGRRMTEGEGWSFADTSLKDARTFGMSRIAVKPQLTGDEKKALAAIDKSLKQLDSVEDETAFDYAAQERLEAERERIEADAALRSYTPEQKKKAGVVLEIGADGSLKIEHGLVKPKESKSDTASPLRSPAPEEPALNYEARNALAVAQNEALGAALLKNQHVAIAAFLASAHVWNSPIGINVQIDRSGRAQSWRSHFETYLGLKTGELVNLVAALAASAGNAQNCDKKDLAALIEQLDATIYDKTLSETFDRKRYFGGCSVKHMLALIEEDLGPDERRRNAEKSQKQLAAFCLDSVAVKGWLPPELRGPNYQPSRKAAPHAKDAKAKVTVTAKKAKPAKKSAKRK